MMRNKAIFSALLVLLSCQQDRSLDVYVDQLPPAVRRLSATAMVDGRPSRRVTVQQRLDHFIFTLAPDTTGTIDLQVKGLDDAGCQLAEGHVLKWPLPEQAGALYVHMEVTVRTCGLLIQKVGNGDGTISSVPTGLSCGKDKLCQTPFSPGNTVTLSADPDKDSFFTGWAGPCAGRDKCTLALDEDPVLLRAGFSLRHVCNGPWCWENPLPQGNDLYGLWAFDSQEVWAVGGGGTVLRDYGPFWARVPLDPDHPIPDNPLSDIWANDHNDLWVVGNGAILHWDGSAFHVAKPNDRLDESYTGVWASGPGDIWVVGHRGPAPLVLRGDGSTWTEVCPGLQSPYDKADAVVLHGIWGAGPDDLWMAGYTFGFNTDVAMAGYGPDLNSTTFAGAVVLRYQAGKCQWLPVPDEVGRVKQGALWRVWGSGPDDVYLVGGRQDGRGSILHATGGQLAIEVPATTTPLPFLLGVWGRDGGDVWFSGGEGSVLHSDGSNIRQVFHDPGRILWSVHGTPEQVWFGGSGGQTLVWDGVARSGEPPQNNLVRVVGPSTGGPDDVYALDTDGGVLQRSGNSWVRIHDGISGDAFTDFLFLTPTEYWTCSGNDGQIFHLRNHVFYAVGPQPGMPLRSLWGWPVPDGSPNVRPQHVWAVGDKGTILHCQDDVHCNGDLDCLKAACVQEPAPPGQYAEPYDLYAIWGNGAQWPPTLTAAGGWSTHGVGILLRKDGTGDWYVSKDDQGKPWPLPGPIRSIWGERADDLWLAGDGGILRASGTTIKTIVGATIGQVSGLRRVFGLGPDSVWAGGVYGVHVHWDGTDLLYEGSGVGTGINDIWGRPGDGLWAVGFNGAIVHRSP